MRSLFLALSILAPASASAAPVPTDACQTTKPVEEVAGDDAASLLSLPRRRSSRNKICKLVLEEHVGFEGSWNKFKEGPPVEWKLEKEKLLDLDHGRITDRVEEGKKYGVDRWVLSMTGGNTNMKNLSTAVSDITMWNAEMFERINASNKQVGDHLSAFCTLPMFDPDAAITELKSCMCRGSPGALINGYESSKAGEFEYYHNNTEYEGFWQTVQDLGAKIYMHPREGEAKKFWEDYKPMRSAAWGFHIETAEHVLRFILSGFFDKFPDVQFIIGHNGEMLAWMAWRMDHRLLKQLDWTPETGGRGDIKMKHNLTWYLKHNFHITSSGMFDVPGFQHALAAVGPDRMMFSIDTAYEDVAEGVEWFDKAHAEGAVAGLTQEQWEDIAYKNAADLLGVPACGYVPPAKPKPVGLDCA